MFTNVHNLISTCFLPKTFTTFTVGLQYSQNDTYPRIFANVHKVYFRISLAQNIHKCSQILFPHPSCQEHSQMFTSYFHISLAKNIHRCSQILFPHLSCQEHSQCSQILFLHLSCQEHSQMFTKFNSMHCWPTTLTKFNHYFPTTCTKSYL